ncbi:MAG: carbohydrate binding family 9 domain-containing protein [Candidatus Aminicenantes bacterium]|nr:carbohydrate binding family 9 domain-containing protein [Candidatus Aminicenantes bacterium]
MKKKALLTGILILLPAAVFLFGDTKRTKAVKAEGPLIIDGKLDEPDWKKAQVVKDFVQFEPQRGRPASQKTEVRILYDEEYITFGFFCYDSQPGRFASQLTKRDSDLTEDDAVFVLLDTFCDQRNCYYFGTNILGTQWDGRITENGRTNDDTWDGIWKSAGHRMNTGWSAEISIALSSIKYSPGEDRVWGLSLGRSIPRSLEYSFWTAPFESPYKVEQFGILEDLDLPRAKKKMLFIPHIITKIEEKKKTEFSAGADAQYAFSQQVSGHLTINPDFATVEADQEEINLTRFELQLPEKRNFFLEGSDIYSQRIRLFYSRRISDIYGGAKVYGKAGGYEFSGMTVQTRPDRDEDTASANFSVLRLKRDVLKSSTVGLLLANKFVDGSSSGTAGLDTSLYFSDRFSFTGQMALSYGDFKKDNYAFFLRPSYDSSTFHIHLRYTQLGRNFADNGNAVGFIKDDNRRELDSAVEKIFWIKKWGIERVSYDSNYNIYWGIEGTLRSWQIDQELSIDLANKLSCEFDVAREYKLYEKDFWNHQTGVSLGYNTREWQSVRISYEFGRNFDLRFKLVEAALNLKLTKDLSLQYALDRLIYDPDPEQESTWIHVVRATQYFTNDLFVKLFFQSHTAIEKNNIQLLFVYRFLPPFGFIQVAYQRGTAGFGETSEQGHTLFLKLTTMF